MRILFFISVFSSLLFSCHKDENGNGDNVPYDTVRVFYTPDEFVMGADLSYVNQILDHGGIYKDSGKVESPYTIFKKYGANVVRFRLFHNPVWTKELYGTSATQMYNDFYDVKEAISEAKAAGLEVCLAFHYSDSWADASKQVLPAAWESLSLTDLKDSIYNYTYKTLQKLDNAGLMPEYVQAGNEINQGFVLPQGSRWTHTTDFVNLINSAIKGIRDAGATSTIKPKIILHIAQPENTRAWFEGLAAKGLTDYDIIGFSYYYMWSNTQLGTISNFVSMLKTTFSKDIMIMETTYPWTTGFADDYDNQINTSKLAYGYYVTEDGQYKYFHALAQEIIEGGGKGIFTWEPAWITSQMKDPWGTGSSWECNTLFDFDGNTLEGIRFMSDKYKF
jgi:arabinogalactan endo-1,4-beta-galactosidase